MPKLYTFYERILAVNMEKMRLDKYLSKVLGVSRSQVAHLVDKKMVLVNGVVAKKSGIFVEESDRVEIAESAESQNLVKNQAKIAESALDSAHPKHEANSSIADEFLGFCEASDKDRILVHRGSEPKQSLKSRCESEFAKIERIYEDSDILVLNKPPFLATHGAPSLKEPSLVEWLKAHKIQRSTISGELREGIVHRLDKQTSGALVVAKNNAAHQALSAQLADKTMTRLYLAIIDLPLKEDIEIECFLARNPKNRLKISKVDVRKYKKTAESSLDSANSQNLIKNSCHYGPFPCHSEPFPCHSEPKAKNLKNPFVILSEAKYLKNKDSSVASLTQNDNVGRDSSLRKCSAQNDKIMKNAESSLDSALPKFARYSKSKFFKLLPSKDGKKELILARLFTGRTHQIRAHLESINRHIIGDELYGYKRGKDDNYRVMLHAYLLQLVHPKDFITQNSAESALDSADSQNLQGGLPRRFCESARNDDFLDSSLCKCFAQNDNVGAENDNLMGFAESNADSATRTKSAESNEKNKSKKPIKSFCYFWLLPKVESPLPLNHNLPNNADSAKLRFIAPLFDDMQDYLAKNFDMEKVDEILRTLPAHAF